MRARAAADEVRLSHRRARTPPEQTGGQESRTEHGAGEKDTWETDHDLHSFENGARTRPAPHRGRVSHSLGRVERTQRPGGTPTWAR